MAAAPAYRNPDAAILDPRDPAIERIRLSTNAQYRRLTDLGGGGWQPLRHPR